MRDYKFEIEIVKEKMEGYLTAGKKIFITSSFQTHSIPMLHIFSVLAPKIPVYFLNTGFHFPETYSFKKQIEDLLHIKVVSLESQISKINQRTSTGKFYYAFNPDYCCHLNKILPLEPILAAHDIWITGVRGDQNANRKSMGMEASGAFDTLRFHPMINWTAKMIHQYRKDFNLPEHPLEKEGYLSVGCEPCTEKYLDGSRDGRWGGMKKNECGLHIELIKK